MQINEHKYLTPEEAASAMAKSLADSLNNAVSLRAKALIAVSGGRTPKIVFKELLQNHLSWDKITITLTDERWVPNNHPESNENLVRTYLLKEVSGESRFIQLYAGTGSLESDVESTESRLQKLQLPFDAVYLGMGTDGHFASLFPGDKNLNVSNSMCIGVPANNSRLARISLTSNTILNARKIFLLFHGEEKYSVYKMAKTPGSIDEIPLRLILLQDKTPVEVYYSL